MGYEKLILSWHAKANEEDYFSKFVFEYLAFIAFLKTQQFSDIKEDRAVIQELKRDENIRNRYINKIQNDSKLRDAWIKIKEELDRIPLGNASKNINLAEEPKWWNCSHNDINQKMESDKHKPSGVIHSLEDWENMVEFWYTIRNNLFHGTKSPEVERDNFAVKYGYKTLKPLVEILLEEFDKIG